MSLIVISVDRSYIAGEKQGGDWPLIIIVNNSMNKATSRDAGNIPL